MLNAKGSVLLSVFADQRVDVRVFESEQALLLDYLARATGSSAWSGERWGTPGHLKKLKEMHAMLGEAIALVEMEIAEKKGAGDGERT